MKFSNKDFFSKCDQSRRKLRIWSYLLKKSLMENFTFCAVLNPLLLNFIAISRNFSKIKKNSTFQFLEGGSIIITIITD